ncbi:MAG: restriction endonuclease subunit S, partial [Lachnospiraceae bacterium]|nr:restriction endonuclease subunit S [Lachnospiraceae bacterium]
MSKLGECVEILDFKRVPLSAKQREKRKKVYPYYGAQGIIDYVDDFIFDGEYILVAEDGNNLKSLSENIATWAKGKFWVNNHAHILGSRDGYNLKYIYYMINSLDLRGYVTGSAQPKLNQDNLANIELNIPDRFIQDKTVEVL